MAHVVAPAAAAAGLREALRVDVFIRQGLFLDAHGLSQLLRGVVVQVGIRVGLQR